MNQSFRETDIVGFINEIKDNKIVSQFICEDLIRNISIQGKLCTVWFKYSCHTDQGKVSMITINLSTWSVSYEEVVFEKLSRKVHGNSFFVARKKD